MNIQSAVLHTVFRTAFAVLAAGFIGQAIAADPDAIGLAPLQREQPALTGAGVVVGQSEAAFGADGYWEVNPATIGQPTSLFTWVSASGSATTFPNTVGNESGHADGVAGIFYGTNGVAPGVQHVRNYEVNYYLNTVIGPRLAEPDMVANNSWVGGISPTMDSDFDDYAATRNVLFVSGMNNATDTPQAPGSCYNGIGVGGLTGNSSVGPTADGRSKPDIVVPGGDLTSFLTPAVSGAAAVLIQAGARGDGASTTATNSTVVKALLLNGAIKPPGWTNGITRPLDARWGAGALNVYNSWQQLHGGRSAYIASSSVTINTPHPPTADTANISTLRGWDYNTLSSSVTSDGITHYYFRLPATGGKFIATATLVWKRASGAATAKNLDLFLYDLAATNLVGSSQSALDNVEHLFLTDLPPGRYDLQVLKHGAALQSGTETYALAWDFVAASISSIQANPGAGLSWPINQAGLVLQSVSSFTSPMAWQDMQAVPFISNGLNTVTVPTANAAGYFRLRRP